MSQGVNFTLVTVLESDQRASGTMILETLWIQPEDFSQLLVCSIHTYL